MLQGAFVSSFRSVGPSVFSFLSPNVRMPGHLIENTDVSLLYAGLHKPICNSSLIPQKNIYQSSNLNHNAVCQWRYFSLMHANRVLWWTSKLEWVAQSYEELWWVYKRTKRIAFQIWGLSWVRSVSRTNQRFQLLCFAAWGNGSGIHCCLFERWRDAPPNMSQSLDFSKT